MRRLLVPLVPILLALGPVACGGPAGGVDAAGGLPDVVADLVWGGRDAARPADTRDAAFDEATDAPRAEPAPEPPNPDPYVDAGAEALTDAPGDAEPAPELPLSPDAAEPDVPPAPDTAEPEPDLPPVPDLVEPPQDVPPPPDDVECSLPAHCDDGKPCTVDTCVAGACQHAKAADSSPCEDGNVCTTGDYCLAGLCFEGALVSCDDGNGCTADTCLPGPGCLHSPKTGGTCDDGDACSGNDTCVAGVCQAGPVDLCPICGDGVCGQPYETCAECVDDCGACSETACADGVDEDWDGATDCADDECAHVLPCYEAACANGQDDDADGASDCADPDCGATEPCAETSCADGVDNDGDGATDCADGNCAAAAACLPTVCQGAVPLACGATTGTERASSNHLNGYSGCSAQTASGYDDIYVVVVPAGVTTLSASLSIVDDDDDDLDLYLLKGQCYATACVDSSTGGSWSESVSSAASPGQVFFVVVEEYSSFGFGDYRLSVSCD